MEGWIANWYSKNTVARIDEQRKLATAIAAQVPQGGHVLEVAPGPGYLSIELAKMGKRKLSGLDISETFVKIERENAAKAGVEIDFRLGDASAMPFEDNTFDFIVCVAAFKNFTFPERALNEFHRTLKPGGKAWINDLRKDATTAEIDSELDGMHLSLPSALFTRLVFRTFLLKNAYTRADINAMVARTNFKTCAIDSDLIGMTIKLEK
jgi:ubiquinone/menaquinone biosynthesis C-methylase UbiE